MANTSVLIVGAGPTGLILALWLTKIGVKVRIIDKFAKAQSTSRALVVHARTLEFYQQLGLASSVLQQGLRFPKVNLWVNHVLKARLNLTDISENLTPFPYVTIFPQDQHEDLLISELKKLGVQVEREFELVSCDQNNDRVQAEIRKPSGEIETVTVPYLAGCDGARSQVRTQLNVGFSGSTYPDLFYVADVVGDGPVFNQELHVSLDEAEFIAIFPLKEKNTPV
jgi:2-polyprenyl-6-methoxyphenol hydroxylase-like FAD-dependent oxidoreductase